VAVFIGVRMQSGPPASPPATAEYNQGGFSAKVSYGQPSKRGRLIFGEAADGALVPYGKYWRLGANAATELSFDQDSRFAGQPVSAGHYRLYAVPGKSSWKVVLNSVLSKWGAFEADHKKDVVTVELPVESLPTAVEQLSLRFAGTPPSPELLISWDTTQVRVPLAGK
jgi:hypothetical protein